ncbi:unnamed protein product [Moneuplotes crassus]|uniref:Uncharacterized protein n=1 Tax=Euplotes crassus TaxID=5936 RepID=A0AAD2D914_EUPCR|nr:unnamed protein product [Moneuplotes crassus]
MKSNSFHTKPNTLEEKPLFRYTNLHNELKTIKRVNRSTDEFKKIISQLGGERQKKLQKRKNISAMKLIRKKLNQSQLEITKYCQAKNSHNLSLQHQLLLPAEIERRENFGFKSKPKPTSSVRMHRRAATSTDKAGPSTSKISAPLNIFSDSIIEKEDIKPSKLKPRLSKNSRSKDCQSVTLKKRRRKFKQEPCSRDLSLENTKKSSVISRIRKKYEKPYLTPLYRKKTLKSKKSSRGKRASQSIKILDDDLYRVLGNIQEQIVKLEQLLAEKDEKIERIKAKKDFSSTSRSSKSGHSKLKFLSKGHRDDRRSSIHSQSQCANSMTSRSSTSALNSSTAIKRMPALISDILLKTQNLAKETNIFNLVFEISRARGDYLIEEKDFTQSLKVFKGLRTYCKVAELAGGRSNLEAEMMVVEQLGHMYGFVQQNKLAADMFRVMLKLAWVLQDANMELKAYGHLANEHFRMGNLEKAKYYHVRFTRGLLESDQSSMKNSILQSYRDKIGPGKKKANLKIKTNNLKKLDEPEILPSPSNNRHQCDKNKSIFAFSGHYYSTKDKLRDFKSKNDEKEEETIEEDENDHSWLKGTYKLLFVEDKFLLKRKTVVKPKPHFLSTKPMKAIESIEKVKERANSLIRVKRDKPHATHTFKEMINNVGSTAIKREQKNPPTINSHCSSLRSRIMNPEESKMREHLEKIKRILIKEKSKLEVIE